jgi:hypothetical protein
MSGDLISREQLLPNGVFYVNGSDPMTSLDELLNRIANAPAVDAVSVIRCKNCVHSEDKGSKFGDLWCRVWNDNTPADGYCHEGE